MSAPRPLSEAEQREVERVMGRVLDYGAALREFNPLHDPSSLDAMYADIGSIVTDLVRRLGDAERQRDEARRALEPFARIARLHAGDEEEDERPVSICNGQVMGDGWHLYGDDRLTRGVLRRAAEVWERGVEGAAK